MDIANGVLALDTFVLQPPLPALEASAAPKFLPLSRVWAAIRSEAASIVSVEQTGERIYVTLERRAPRGATPRLVLRRLEVLERLLLGASGKELAYELDVSISTIATDRVKACRTLGLDASLTGKHMFLVMAVHAAFGFIDTVAQVHESNARRTILSIERPERHVASRVTRAELEVLIDIGQGFTHATIAQRRGRSARTIANQLASIFHKLRVSGRGALLALLARESRRMPGRLNADA